jgi:hypothetical protein
MVKNRFAHYLVISIIAIVLFTLLGCSKEKPVFPGGKVIKDDFYHYQFRLPNTWKVKYVKKVESQFRLKATGSKAKELFVYAINAKTIIDLEKLADYSDKYFKGVGKLQAKKYYPDYLFVPWPIPATSIVKTYKDRDSITHIFIQAQGPYGYYLIYRGSDSKEFREITSSFKAVVPFKEMEYAQVNYLVVFVLALLLGNSGFSFRKKLNKLKIIKMVEIEDGSSGKLRKHRRNIVARLWFAPLWCVFLYLFGIYFLQSDVRTIYIIVGPVLPILGYFGIIREPPDAV